MIRLAVLLAAVAGVLSAQQHPDLTIDLLGTPQLPALAVPDFRGDAQSHAYSFLGSGPGRETSSVQESGAYAGRAAVSPASASSSDEKTRFTSRIMMNSSPRFPIP
jgi:hypothetical protein